MSRASLSRRLPLFVLALLLTAPLFLAACGGGGGSGGNANDADLMVVYFNFRNRTDVYRNDTLEFRLTAPVKEGSVDIRTFRVLSGPQQQTPVPGARIVDGDRIFFDPTRSQSTYDRGDTKPDQPFGFDALSTYQIYIPGPEVSKTIRNMSGDKIVAEYISSFTTSDLYIPEKIQPNWIGYSFDPPPNPDGSINFEAGVVLEFDEPIDPSTVEPGTTVSVYRRINVAVPGGGTVVKEGEYPVSVEPSRDGTKFTLIPAVNWGSEADVTITLTEGIKDLAGNPLVPRPLNATQTNPFNFTSEVKPGLTLVDFVTESFDTNLFEDTNVTDPGEWNSIEEGALLGGPILTEITTVSPQPNNSSTFIFNLSWPMVADPPNASCLLYPNGVSWAKGIRLQNSFTTTEMGGRGSITTLEWSPSSNFTFAATYPTIELRLGHASRTDGVLGLNFNDNYRDGEPLPSFTGQYSVPTQDLTGGPLVDANGHAWWPFPTLTTPFDYDGLGGLIVDYGIRAGGTCQGWKVWSYTFLTGGPGRRMAGAQDIAASQDDGFITFGGRTPENILFTRFTKKRRVTNAQSLFYDTEIPTPNFDEPIISPAAQQGGATYVLEFQGADGMIDPLDPTQSRYVPDLNTVTTWSLDIDTCDDKQFIRFRFTLEANLVSETVPRIAAVQIPYTFQQN